ncbi:flagellar filament capping protein FliD [Puerhibacterium puerhi]|uniref:flagellar filament capping protein FliD n=1 Tax=Puerhibacterium puerhi TaxID=2692623 RepID=UPI00135CC9DB|nr:flagellar filament capping protein FliD [Puerhibacterium puerhi]
MATLGIDGLISGLDTTSLINSLMQVEAAPQTLLKNKQTQATNLVAALQALNTKVASLAETAAKAAKADSWQAAKATSSVDSVTATVSGATAASAGELTFTVEQVATAKVVTTAVPAALTDVVAAGDPPSITITRGSGADATSVTIKPASGNLQDVAAAINANADAGVRASIVRSGTDDDGTALYRLQLTGTATGTDGDFTVSGLSGGLQDVRPAQDAVLVLGSGDRIEQSSNTFEGLVLGIDVTVSAAAVGQSVTVGVARDDEALSKLASDLVDALGVVLSEITARTATRTTTDSAGNAVVTGGLFSGDSAVRSLQERLLSAASNPVDGVSPSAAGINIDRYGAFTFDGEKFAEALAADPAKVQSIVSGLAQRVADLTDAASDPYEGTLTRKIQGQQTELDDLADQIADWDRRLEVRREGLQATYSALEVTLSNLQAQSSWLTSQLASLTTSSSSS